MPMRTLWCLLLLSLLPLLSGCGETKPNTLNPNTMTEPGAAALQGPGLFGDPGVELGNAKSKPDQGAGSGIGVNAYLWRGALDTLSFMPLASADPFGGVIITDWYTPPASSGERFKATAYILGRQLRSDGVRVSIFRQVLQNGQWVDAPVSAVTVGDIENKVLSRARELREQSEASS